MAIHDHDSGSFLSWNKNGIVRVTVQKNTETRIAAPTTPADNTLLEARFPGFDGAEATEDRGTPPVLPFYSRVIVSEKEDSPLENWNCVPVNDEIFT